MARGATRELKIRIKGEDKVSQVFAGVSRSSKGATSAFVAMRAGLNQVAVAFGAVSTAGGVFLAFSTRAVKASSDQATGIAQLDRALKAAGTSYAEAGESIEQFAAHQQATTRYGDDETRRVLTNLVQLTGSYGSHTLTAARAVQDMAEGAQMPLNAASRLVSQAIAGNISSLTRYIPSLRGMKSETFAALDATERTRVVVDALSGTFGGAATAIDDTALAMAQVRNRLGDVVEEFGDAIRESGQFAQGLRGLERGLQALEKHIQDNGEAISAAFVTITGAATKALLLMGDSVSGLIQLFMVTAAAVAPIIERLDLLWQVATGDESERKAAVEALIQMDGIIDQMADGIAAAEVKTTALNDAWTTFRENVEGSGDAVDGLSFPTLDLSGGGGRGGRPQGVGGGGSGPAAINLAPDNLAESDFPEFDKLVGRSPFQEELAGMLAGPGRSFEAAGPPEELKNAQEEAAISADMLANSAINLSSALASAAMDSENATERITMAVLQMLAQMAAASLGGPLGILVGGGIGIAGSLIGGSMGGGVGGRRAGRRASGQIRRAESARMVRT